MPGFSAARGVDEMLSSLAAQRNEVPSCTTRMSAAPRRRMDLPDRRTLSLRKRSEGGAHLLIAAVRCTTPSRTLSPPSSPCSMDMRKPSDGVESNGFGGGLLSCTSSCGTRDERHPVRGGNLRVHFAEATDRPRKATQVLGCQHSAETSTHLGLPENRNRPRRSLPVWDCRLPAL